MNKIKKIISKLTLKEILLSIGILILIFIIVLPLCRKHKLKENCNRAKLQISLLEQGVNSFKQDTGKFPESIDELFNNRKYLKNWNGPYIKDKDTLTDPWGKNFFFKLREDKMDFDIICYGKDGAAGGKIENADITNRP